jgi:2-octaprenyl-6-methoxyphenol hydroxylase
MDRFSYPIVIVGGGFIGPLIALTLGKKYGPVYLVDPNPLECQLTAPSDGRAIAVTQASKKLLERLNIWPALGSYAQPLSAVVTQEPNGAEMRMTSEDTFGETIGYMIDSKVLKDALLRTLHKQSFATFLTDQVLNLEYQTPFQSSLSLELASGTTIAAALVIGADGARSRIRLAANLRTHHWDYDQIAFVRTYQHSNLHKGRAYETFLDTGPFAILPLPNNCSSIVWTVSAEKAKQLQSLTDQDFDKEAIRHMPGYKDVTPYSPVRAFSLKGLWVPFFTSHRIALVGDAAHQIHPLAGQGLNLGFYDVEALEETLSEGLSLGLDIGSQTLLKRYEQKQRWQHLSFLGATHGINSLFSNDDATLAWLRTKGLELVEKTSGVKRFFAQHGAGIRQGVS